MGPGLHRSRGWRVNKKREKSLDRKLLKNTGGKKTPNRGKKTGKRRDTRDFQQNSERVVQFTSGKILMGKRRKGWRRGVKSRPKLALTGVGPPAQRWGLAGEISAMHN